jgi:aspartyl-tRNA(Asn)/glutamyl-tRNA(Gln) amidotransferase subunit A
MKANYAAMGVASMGLDAGGDETSDLIREATEVRQRNWLRFRKLFRKYDLLLCPTIHGVAPTIDVFSTRTPSGLAIAEATPGACAYAAYTGQFNVLRFPAVSVPCGFVDGLPVGLQIVGSPALTRRYFDWRTRSVRPSPRSERPPVS